MKSPRHLRQRIRSGIIVFSFLLLPITQFYFSPYLIVWGASKGIITASFFTFAVLLLGSLFIGRAFCGWVMPCAGMQETYFQINNNPPKTGKLNLLKFIIWAPWVLSIIIVFIIAGGYKKTDYLFHLEYGISVNNVYMYIPFYIVIIIFFLNSVIFGKRANCHYICWMSPFMIIGRLISNRLNLKALRLKADRTKCKECKLCNKSCPMSLDVLTMVQNNNMENTECILCGNCVDACLKDSIHYYFGKKNI